MVISDGHGKIFWAKRFGEKAWQFPQGGIDGGETIEQALYRELYEEVGLKPSDVRIVRCTKKWLHYRIPKHMQRKHSSPRCIGQKQKWFFLELTGSQEKINFNVTNNPEFDAWEWVHFWYPINAVISFKRSVYRRALCEFASYNTILEKRSRVS
jgi:putative (di)nucleoside polyphosphate hydrolase